jgi:hypothetical protein
MSKSLESSLEQPVVKWYMLARPARQCGALVPHLREAVVARLATSISPLHVLFVPLQTKRRALVSYLHLRLRNDLIHGNGP